MHRLTPSAARLLLFAAALLLAGLSGCSAFDGIFDNVTVGEEEEIQRGASPETRLREGMEAFDVGKYRRAADIFSTLLAEHPFSSQAGLAQLKLADARYHDGKYEEAKEQYKEFESRYPTNEAIPYVLFQSGMCDFAQADHADRDPNAMVRAVDAFTRLLNAAPHSAYAQEAAQKIREAREHLASHELSVAEFYKRTGKFGAARQRLRHLLAVYPDSVQAPVARALLDELGE